jgi:GT2 family glycosyltransferase
VSQSAQPGVSDERPDHAGAAVIVPCIEIERLTTKCVDECFRQFPAAEIIVLADAPDNQERIAGKARVVVTGPITIPAKRNRGARETERPVLAFIDSDAFPGVGWLDNAVRGLREHPEAGAVAGPNVPPLEQPLSEHFVGIALQSEFCAHNASYVKRPAASVRLVNNMPSSNLIVRRDEYLAMGGMDERFNGGEDVEFCRRLVKANKPILYMPDVLIYHKNRRFSQFVLQRFAYGANDMAAVMRRGACTNVKALLPACMVLFLLTGIALPWVQLWRWIYFPITGLYLAVLVAEAARHSHRLVDIPGALAAMLVATLVPGMGALARVVGVMPDLKKIYRNDR